MPVHESKVAAQQIDQRCRQSSRVQHEIEELAAMMTFITRGDEGREDKNKDRKLREAKAEGWKRGLVARSFRV
jgi:hypothetical protein